MTRSASPAVGARRARIFPELGWAAMSADETVLYVTWCALSVLDTRGSGLVPRHEARDLIAQWRGIDPASARRLIRQGIQAGYWDSGVTRNGVQALFPASSARLLIRFGLQSERAPHLVSLDLLRTPAAMRAHLYAACHEIPGHSQRFKNAPLARATKRAMTGIAETTQRRYDRFTTEKVQECYAEVETDSPVLRQGHGFFIGRGGVQLRRLPDYRMPVGHVLASKSAAAHARRKARALREEGRPGTDVQPVANSRGQSEVDPGLPSQRVFFSGASESSAMKRSEDKYGRKPEHAIYGWGYAGEMKFRIVEPS